jgi:CRISPR-associated protein Cas1
MILHQAEHYLSAEKRLHLARLFIDGAVKNIMKVLSYYQNRGVDLKTITSMVENISQNIQNALSNEELMAIEGNIREQYYKAFDLILNNEHFVFEARTKRPPLKG